MTLDCACAVGLCTTLVEDLSALQNFMFGTPYYVAFGTCQSGHTKLRYEEALENAWTATYDEAALVYRRGSGYIFGFGAHGDRHPQVDCDEPGLASYEIGGPDPATDCVYCLVRSDDGAGGDGPQDAYEESGLPECERDGDGRPTQPL